MHAPDRRRVDGEGVGMEQDRATFDPETGNVIRPTDNSLRECDLPGVNQEPKVLEIQNGIPVGLELPKEAG